MSNKSYIEVLVKDYMKVKTTKKMNIISYEINIIAKDTFIGLNNYHSYDKVMEAANEFAKQFNLKIKIRNCWK